MTLKECLLRRLVYFPFALLYTLGGFFVYGLKAIPLRHDPHWMDGKYGPYEWAQDSKLRLRQVWSGQKAS